MRKWKVDDSAELYNINGWGVNYFSINEKGNVEVTPARNGVAVDLKELIDELDLSDVATPVLIRFPDILDDRIEREELELYSIAMADADAFAERAQPVERNWIAPAWGMREQIFKGYEDD